MDNNPKERVLTKINDISDFINSSTEDLEEIKRCVDTDSREMNVSPNLVIVGLNADKIF